MEMTKNFVSDALRTGLNKRPGKAMLAALFAVSTAVFFVFARYARYALIDEFSGDATAELAMITAAAYTVIFALSYAIQLRVGRKLPVYMHVLTAFLTGLVILLVGSPSSADTPMSLVFRSFFVSLGKFSLFPLLFCIFLFAHSTVICWYYYGRKSLSYLGAEKLKIPFLIAFVLFLLMPSFSSGYFAVFAADIFHFDFQLIFCVAVFFNKRNFALFTIKIFIGKRIKSFS